MSLPRLRSIAIMMLAAVMAGCWANPVAIRIASTPPGAKVWYQEQELGVTPLNSTLACDADAQFVHLELAGYKSRDITLTKRKIRYFVPWYAVVAAGLFTFQTTWRSRACNPNEVLVDMIVEQPVGVPPQELEKVSLPHETAVAPTAD